MGFSAPQTVQLCVVRHGTCLDQVVGISCVTDGNRESRYCTEDSPHRNLAMPMPMPMRPHNVFFARSSKESALAKSIGSQTLK